VLRATLTLGLSPGESKLLKYHSAAEYHSTTTSVTIVPPGYPASWRMGSSTVAGGR
jgi:saccharopine dehydrogenase-like NADP-dependent oxidoreductase